MIITELPDIIDLFDVAFAANMNLHLSVQAVGETATGNIASELRLATERYYDGLRMREALDLAVDELGDEVRPLVRLLCDTSMSPEIARLQLAVLSLEARNDRRRQAEIAARKVPVKLLLPLVFNVLPAFGLLTVVPVVIGSLQQIRS